MKNHEKEIILTDLLHIKRNQIFDESRKVYFPGAAEMFSKIVWSHFEEEATITKPVYGELVEAIITNNKKLTCYLPKLNFPDDNWFDSLNVC